MSSGADGHDSGPSATFVPGDTGERTWVGDEEASAEVFEERYVVLAELGRGAIGVVERVFDRHLDRAVARKRLLDDRPASRRRFVLEARVTASLAHPGIPPVYDLGVDEEAPYYTMLEIVGRPWKELVAEADGLDGRLAQLDVLLAVARAVAHAHEAGLVHRDLKLSNVMVGPLGDVFVVDWGLCVPAGSQGVLAGTPQYMSPEQARGEPIHPPVDVWALGIMLFRLLTHRAPYPGPRSEDVVEQARAGQLPDAAVLVPEAPAELVDIVHKATAAPGERYPDAGAFAADLKAFLQGQWVTAHDYTIRELARRVWRQQRLRIVAGLAVASFLGAGLVTSVRAVSNERDRAVLAEADRVRQLATSMEEQAAAAPIHRWEPMAERKAAEALALNAHLPRAWGVLARHAATDHPVLAWSVPTPCPVEAANGHRRILLACDDTFHVADLSDAGQLGPLEEVPNLPPVGTDSERAHHYLVGDLVVRDYWSRSWVVRVGGEVLVSPSDESVPKAVGRYRGELGVLLSSSPDQLHWLREDGTRLDVGAQSYVRGAAVDGDGMYLWVPKSGVMHCTGSPAECTAVLPHDGITHVAAGHGWLAADDTRRGLILMRTGSTDFQVLPVDAGAHTQLVVLERHLAALRIDGDVDIWTLEGVAVARLPTRHHQPNALVARGERLWVLGDGVAAWDLGSSHRANHDVMTGGLTHRDGVPITASKGQLEWLTDPPVAGPAPAEIVKDADVTPDGAVVYSPSSGSPVRWDPITQAIHTYPDLPSPGRRLVVTADGSALITDYSKRVTLLRPDGRVELADGECWGDVARSADRSTIVCGFDEKLVQLDPSTGATLATLATEKRALWAVAVSSKGDRVAYALHDHSVIELDRTTGTSRRIGPRHEGHVSKIAYSPDDRWIATGSWDQRVHVHRASDLELVAVLEGHRGRVVGLEFASDDSLTSVGWDRSLWRWDLSVLEQTPREHLLRIAEETGLAGDGLEPLR